MWSLTIFYEGKIFQYFSCISISISWNCVGGLMVVCVGGGGGVMNKGINYQVCNTTQRCIYKLIN